MRSLCPRWIPADESVAVTSGWLLARARDDDAMESAGATGVGKGSDTGPTDTESGASDEALCDDDAMESAGATGAGKGCDTGPTDAESGASDEALCKLDPAPLMLAETPLVAEALALARLRRRPCTI